MYKIIINITRWVGSKALSFVAILLVLSMYGLAQHVTNLAQEYDAEIQNSEKILENMRQAIVSLSETGTKKTTKYLSIEHELKHLNSEIDSVIGEMSVLASGPGRLIIHVPGNRFHDRYHELENSRESLEWKRDLAFSKMQRLEGIHRREVTELQEGVKSEEKKLAQLKQSVEEDVIVSIWNGVRENVSAALSIILGVIFAPILIKVFVYYVLAPIASRRPSIQIANGSSNEWRKNDVKNTKISSPTINLEVKSGNLIMIKPDYITSTPAQANKSTQLFINNKIPFSSIATGLYGLTRIQCEKDCSVSISCQNSPIMELAAIHLGANDLFVCHPRMLVGVVNDGGVVNITKHWRLFSLHSWITLHLRYLVMHGPCIIILEGARGIRAETAEETRVINQSATLGYSANLHYSNSRCETFYSYMTGKDDLFNDVFSGSNGFFVYEEYPVLRRNPGVTGRGIEGVLDAALKIFGL